MVFLSLQVSWPSLLAILHGTIIPPASILSNSLSSLGITASAILPHWVHHWLDIFIYLNMVLVVLESAYSCKTFRILHCPHISCPLLPNWGSGLDVTCWMYILGPLKIKLQFICTSHWFHTLLVTSTTSACADWVLILSFWFRKFLISTLSPLVYYLWIIPGQVSLLLVDIYGLYDHQPMFME